MILELLDRPGVYFLLNTVSNKWYVGSSVSSIRGRVLDHISKLRQGKHSNPHLQAAWDKYGEEAFTFGTLCVCKPLDCLLREQEWIDNLQAADRSRGYNICPKAGSRLGVKVSDASRERIAAAQRGKKLSAAHKAKVAAGNRGKVMSLQSRSKMSVAMMGNTNGRGRRKPYMKSKELYTDILMGRRFGRLVVTEFCGNKPHAKWKCKCDCGGSTVAYANNLKRGISKSCGCLRRERIEESNRNRRRGRVR